MHIFIEILPLLLGGLIGTAVPFRVSRTEHKLAWLVLGGLFAFCTNQLSGEGLIWLPVDLLLVSVSAYFVFKVRQHLVSS